jgi:hypothetical protein
VGAPKAFSRRASEDKALGFSTNFPEMIEKCCSKLTVFDCIGETVGFCAILKN